MGILAFGLCGILTLFPLAIRNTQMALDRTSESAVARNAIASLTRLGLAGIEGRVYPVVPQVTTSTGAYLLTDATQFSGISEAIFKHHRSAPDFSNCVGDDSSYPRGGGPWPSFKIPGDFANEAAFRDVDGDGHGDLVSVPWNPGLGWTAVFMPISEDDDGDTFFDEDWWNSGVDDDTDGPSDEDDLVMPTTRYRVQVAVWRNYGLIYDGADPSGTYVGTFWGGDGADNDGDTNVDEADEQTTIELAWDPSDARPADYVRFDSHGFWYEIEELKDAPTAGNHLVVLKRPFKHPSAQDFQNVPVSVASRWKLVHLEETVVGGP